MKPISLRICTYGNSSKDLAYSKLLVWVGGVKRKIAVILSKINRVVFTCDISPRVYISKTTGLRHQGLGVVIHPNAIIGENAVIRQHVSIGTNAKPGQGGLAPKIGNNVMIGAGACVLGSITIGDNVSIGANAVVLCDVPDNCIAVGVPAKVICRTSKRKENIK